MQTTLQDLRFALRQFLRAPGFAFTVVVTLALSVGIATAVFSVIDATLIRALPYDKPDSIVMLRTYSPQGYGQPASYPQYLDWRKENSALQELAGFEGDTANFEGPQGPSPVRTMVGTDNFFRVFGVKPLLGRTFLPGEDQPGKNGVAVLSYSLWRENFGADPHVVGSRIKLDGEGVTVIGVMPAGFRIPLGLGQDVELYRPLQEGATQLANRGSHWLPVIGRMKDGYTAAQAQADMNRVFNDIGRVHPDEAGRRASVMTIAEALLGHTEGPLTALSLAVLGVLAIGCVNVAGLLLARGVRRERELSLRTAIGAGRARILRQLLTESAVLAVAGAVGGVALAFTLLQLLKQLLVESMARGAEIHINPTVLAAALGISLATGFLASLLPALQFSKIAPAQVMRSGGAAGTSRGQSRLRGALIVAQVAIALGLLVCSGLLMKNLHALRATDLGFDPRNLLTEDVMLTSPEYQKRDVLGTFYNPLLDRVRAIPGVEGATLINKLPIAFSGMNADVHIVGHPPAPANQERLAELRLLSPGFEKVLGTRLVRGRLLSDSLDTPTSQTVVTVNESFVRKFFAPGEDPIGKQIDWDKGLTIVGVTSDVRQDLVEAPMAEMDFAAAQQMNTWGITSAELVIRTKVPPESIVAPLRAAMHQVDPTVPFRPAMTMDDIMNGTLTMQRLESWLFGTFAGLALLLSLVGIYGMVAHEVELKTRDIGIRMALGSTRGLVVRQILQRVATLMLFGIGTGWVLTLALQKVLASVVTLSVAQDAWLLAAITATLALFGVSASFLPSRRAASINPIEALRTE